MSDRSASDIGWSTAAANSVGRSVGAAPSRISASSARACCSRSMVAASSASNARAASSGCVPTSFISEIWDSENPRSTSRLIRSSRTRCVTRYCL